MTLEFMSDGSVAMSPGAMVDGEYRLEGNQLTVTFKSPHEGAPAEAQKYEVRIEGNRLTQRELTKGIEARMERVGAAPLGEPSIVGEWKSESTPQANPGLPPEFQAGAAIIGQNARTTFTSDGRMLLRIPFRQDLGTYSVSGNRLVMAFGREEMRGTFRIEGDSLFLTYQGSSRATELRRAAR